MKQEKEILNTKETTENNVVRKNSKDKKNLYSRRDFFALSSAAIAATAGITTLAMGALSADEAHANTTKNKINKNIHPSLQVHEWPWEVNYAKEHEIEVDVLVIGGGLAGCHAAINAQRQNASVAVIDKGAIAHSGSGGAGIDHWLGCNLNPASGLNIRMLEKMQPTNQGFEYGVGLARYIALRENYDALLDLEEWGLKIRDTDDEFKGSIWRDEKSKLLFAYNSDLKTNIRIFGGAKMKQVLHNEMTKRKIAMYDYTMATSLLTEDGKFGAKVIGATGLNIRTGEFYIFKAKSVVLSSSRPQKLWVFGYEQNGSASSFYDPNNTGDGYDIAWRAGAEFVNMEYSHPKIFATGEMAYPSYGAGNAHNTWYPCNIVDDNGKEVPWVNPDGKILKTVEERYKAAEKRSQGLEAAKLIPDLPERIAKGEYKLPLYADLPGMPADERRVIWGLHVGNEGKTRYAIYDLYQKHGFDPDKDMLQVPVMPPNSYTHQPWWMGVGAPQNRDATYWSGSLLVDWKMSSTLQGLFAAGGIGGIAGASAASATGRYAGRQAAIYAQSVQSIQPNREQIETEKERVYAPVTRQTTIGWKDLRAGLCRVMQDYCGQFRSEATLKLGLNWFKTIKDNEMQQVCAHNPRELARVLECMVHANVGEMMLYASLERKATIPALGLMRLDYPEKNPKEWKKYLPMKKNGNKVSIRSLPLNYWRQAPNAKSFNENYTKHSKI